MIAKHLIAILWVGRYPVRDFTMYIHRRAEQRSGKLAGYWQREERNSNDNNGGVGDVAAIPHIYWLF